MNILYSSAVPRVLPLIHPRTSDDTNRARAIAILIDMLRLYGNPDDPVYRDDLAKIPSTSIYRNSAFGFDSRILSFDQRAFIPPYQEMIRSLSTPSELALLYQRILAQTRWCHRVVLENILLKMFWISSGQPVQIPDPQT